MPWIYLVRDGEAINSYTKKIVTDFFCSPSSGKCK